MATRCLGASAVSTEPGSRNAWRDVTKFLGQYDLLSKEAGAIRHRITIQWGLEDGTGEIRHQSPEKIGKARESVRSRGQTWRTWKSMARVKQAFKLVPTHTSCLGHPTSLLLISTSWQVIGAIAALLWLAGCAALGGLLVAEFATDVEQTALASEVSPPPSSAGAPRTYAAPVEEQVETVLARPLFSPTRRAPEAPAANVTAELAPETLRLAGIVTAPADATVSLAMVPMMPRISSSFVAARGSRPRAPACPPAARGRSSAHLPGHRGSQRCRPQRSRRRRP